MVFEQSIDTVLGRLGYCAKAYIHVAYGRRRFTALSLYTKRMRSQARNRPSLYEQIFSSIGSV